MIILINKNNHHHNHNDNTTNVYHYDYHHYDYHHQHYDRYNSVVKYIDLILNYRISYYVHDHIIDAVSPPRTFPFLGRRDQHQHSHSMTTHATPCHISREICCCFARYVQVLRYQCSANKWVYLNAAFGGCLINTFNTHRKLGVRLTRGERVLIYVVVMV